MVLNPEKYFSDEEADDPDCYVKYAGSKQEGETDDDVKERVGCMTDRAIALTNARLLSEFIHLLPDCPPEAKLTHNDFLYHDGPFHPGPDVDIQALLPQLK